MIGTDISKASYRAQQISDGLNVAYWVGCYAPDRQKYHINKAHEDFAELAEAMGYTITRNSEPVALRMGYTVIRNSEPVAEETPT